MMVTNGQKAPVGGWFLDQHGHRLYLQRGQIVPLCPIYGPFSAVQWRLSRVVEG